MVDENINQDLNIIKDVIGLGFREIISYLNKHDKNFLISDDLEKKLKDLDPNVSNEVNQLFQNRKPIGENTKVKSNSSVLERASTRGRGRDRINQYFCDYSKVQSCIMLKSKHNDWLEKINQDNRDIKTAYDEYNIVLVCQYCKLTIERTSRLILDKILSDKDEKLINAFIKTKEYYDSKEWDGYPLIFIGGQGNLNNSKRYSKFCNGYYLDTQEYKKSNIPFYLYLILEYIFCDFYNRRQDMKDYYLYFTKINRYRNASRESGHDSEPQVNIEKSDIQKLKNFLEWFVNNIAYSCLNK